MSKRLIVKAASARKLLSAGIMHQLGKLFLCHVGGREYKAIYFSQSTVVFFEGPLASPDRSIDAIVDAYAKAMMLETLHSMALLFPRSRARSNFQGIEVFTNLSADS
ncbi:MAG: hypothetical protein JSV57_01900 [Candidatus Bathyarchaeota archaeon]|nr:MAG: hypothetical protein JSV57_01900 [Candidatus Bathyarchaeota archaeon]